MHIQRILFIFLLVSSLSLSLSAKTLRIMPLGDSITYDNNHADDTKPRSKSKRHGYRNYLWYMLKDANISADFVGTRHAGSAITPPFDIDNEGYPGETSYEIAERTYDILQKNAPDVILLHVGTNDHSDGVSGLNDILDWVDTYENDTNHPIRVLVAIILDRKVHDLHIEAFNKNLVKLVKKRWKKGDILTLVDMYTGAKLNDSDYADITHPNDNGYKKMAKVWYKAIKTPYVKYTSAPLTKDDQISGETGNSVSLNILANDTDEQNDMNRSSVSLVGGKDTDGDGDLDELTVSNQGKWSVTENGIVTFIPEKNFTNDPSPIRYTVKDDKGKISAPAQISIDYTNRSLQNFPHTLVAEAYIQSTSIDEASNSIEFITMIPDEGILF